MNLRDGTASLHTTDRESAFKREALTPYTTLADLEDIMLSKRSGELLNRYTFGFYFVFDTSKLPLNTHLSVQEGSGVRACHTLEAVVP